MKTKIAKSKINIFLGFLSLITYLLLPDQTYAQVNIGQQYNSPIKNITDVGSNVSRIATNLYIIAGIILFILFLWGGFEYIKGAGSDDRDAIGKGKKVIMSAIVGFLIIFSSYWIIQLVELFTHIQIF